ncbi:SsgA family sporulation/cell division regulator [Actinacidiphila yeochonensis]|uniref:SsgA family sporulation/cell division regulator n=1 Tax=Actinacidiphila yeochonensis TaxID=89050 RepID=UPI00055D29FB|nr:SsgA family sporulation/cell division regulator [Actinacidiphila yeochonensis]
MTHPSSSTAATSVAHDVVAHVAVTGEPPVTLPAALRYDASHPYAVCLSIGTTSPRPVEWVFARGLLAEGMCRPAGLGDVLVRPRRSRCRDWARIVVRSAAGAAVLDVAAEAVTAFLEQAAAVVPPGTEGAHLDLDRVVAELLGRGA